MPETMQETVKQKGLLRRSVCAEQIRIVRQDDQNVMTFPASSEEPVERWWGMEILSHDDAAVRLARATDGAMPLLFNHDVNDPIGMITGARLEKNRLMVDAQLFATERAAEIKTMIEGGLRNVSLAYRINVIEENTKTETYTVTDWEPYEVSIVTVPADPTVGIGRGAETEYEVRMIRALHQAPSAATREASMPEESKKEAAAVAAGDQRITSPELESARTASAVDLEKRRVKAIETLCQANKLDDNYRAHWVGTGQSIEQIADDILRILEERGRTNPQPVTKIGLDNKEAQRFSLARAISACSEKNWSNAGFELECSRAIAQRLNQVPNPNRFFVPFEVMERPVGRRDLTVASAGGGGYLVETQNVGFIEMLRNRSVAFRMGARRLSGLVGNVTVPRQSAAGTAYWLTNESTQVTESQQTFVQVSLSPKNVGAYTEISRQLLLQSSPAAEGIVSDDLAQIVAIAADLAVLNGSGASGQPTGIINTAGIGAVTGTSLAFAGVLEFQTDVAGSNVMPARGGYITTPAVSALMMQRVKFTSTASPLWEGNVWDGQMCGYPAMSSNQVPSANMIYGDWNEVVVGEWGVLEIEVNPYANFQAGIVGVRALYSLDVAVRRAFAFSLSTSIT